MNTASGRRPVAPPVGPTGGSRIPAGRKQAVGGTSKNGVSVPRGLKPPPALPQQPQRPEQQQDTETKFEQLAEHVETIEGRQAMAKIAVPCVAHLLAAHEDVHVGPLVAISATGILAVPASDGSVVQLFSLDKVVPLPELTAAGEALACRFPYLGSVDLATPVVDGPFVPQVISAIAWAGDVLVAGLSPVDCAGATELVATRVELRHTAFVAAGGGASEALCITEAFGRVTVASQATPQWNPITALHCAQPSDGTYIVVAASRCGAFGSARVAQTRSFDAIDDAAPTLAWLEASTLLSSAVTCIGDGGKPQLVITGAQNGAIHLWSVADGRLVQLQQLLQVDSVPSCVRVLATTTNSTSPSPSLCVLGMLDGTIVLASMPTESGDKSEILIQYPALHSGRGAIVTISPAVLLEQAGTCRMSFFTTAAGNPRIRSWVAIGNTFTSYTRSLPPPVPRVVTAATRAAFTKRGVKGAKSGAPVATRVEDPPETPVPLRWLKSVLPPVRTAARIAPSAPCGSRIYSCTLLAAAAAASLQTALKLRLGVCAVVLCDAGIGVVSLGSSGTLGTRPPSPPPLEAVPPASAVSCDDDVIVSPRLTPMTTGEYYGLPAKLVPNDSTAGRAQSGGTGGDPHQFRQRLADLSDRVQKVDATVHQLRVSFQLFSSDVQAQMNDLLLLAKALPQRPAGP